MSDDVPPFWVQFMMPRQLVVSALRVPRKEQVRRDVARTVSSLPREQAMSVLAEVYEELAK
jgi:hypothetical protein